MAVLMFEDIEAIEEAEREVYDFRSIEVFRGARPLSAREEVYGASLYAMDAVEGTLITPRSSAPEGAGGYPFINPDQGGDVLFSFISQVGKVQAGDVLRMPNPDNRIWYCQKPNVRVFGFPKILTQLELVSRTPATLRRGETPPPPPTTGLLQVNQGLSNFGIATLSGWVASLAVTVAIPTTNIPIAITNRGNPNPLDIVISNGRKLLSWSLPFVQDFTPWEPDNGDYLVFLW